MNQTLRFGALALSIVLISGCARAQNAAPKPDPDAEQPQPEAVKGPPAFVPPAPLACTVWRAGQSGTLLLSGPLQNYVGPVVAFDFSGHEVWRAQAKAGQTQIPIAVSEVGLHTLKAGEQTYSFSVVPVPIVGAARVNSTLWGLNTHLGQRETADEAYQVLQNAGVDAVRDELGWGATEKTKGVFTFPARHLEYTAKLKEHNIGLWFSASYGNKLYPSTPRYPAPEAAGPFANYVVTELKKFGDNIVGVEIFNEPNAIKPVVDYLPVLKETYRQVRAAGFTQPIVAVGGAGPAGGGMAPGFARAIYQNGAAQFSDGFSQHPYMAPFTPDTGYGGGKSNLDVALTRAEAVVKQYKLKGNWITELGWASIPPGEVPTAEEYQDKRSARTMVNESKQAAFTARTVLGASKYPTLRGLFLYDFQDDGPIPLRREHKFGLVRQDLQPKMGFQAFAVASNFVKDKTFESRRFEDNSLLSANFYRARNGDLWAAVWSMEVTRDDAAAEKEGKIGLPDRAMEIENRVPFRFVGASAQSALDWQGAPLPTAPMGVATSLPIYVNLGAAPKTVTVEAVGAEPKVAMAAKADAAANNAK